jgi:glycosyltransferase involved in cell wall biosynthesis
LVKELKARIHKEGLDEDVDWLPNISREEKISFLQSLTLFSVPVTYPEAFGLYVLEAIACGVPVVQPEMASFPEIIESTGGGTCVPRNNPKDFAEAWDSLLNDPERLEAMRKQGREKVEEHFSSPQMSKQFLQLTRAYQPTN